MHGRSRATFTPTWVPACVARDLASHTVGLNRPLHAAAPIVLAKDFNFIFSSEFGSLRGYLFIYIVVQRLCEVPDYTSLNLKLSN